MTGAEIEARLNDAIGQIMREEGEMATRWIALVEVIDSDGERGLRTMTSEDLSAWDSKGLLTQALDVERAATIAQAIRD